MSLLVGAEQLEERKLIARGPLSALADGLRRELDPLVTSPPNVPRDKALLSRSGGRCTEGRGPLLGHPALRRSPG